MILTVKDAMCVLMESGVNVDIHIANRICVAVVNQETIQSDNMSEIASWLKEKAKLADDGFF